MNETALVPSPVYRHAGAASKQQNDRAQGREQAMCQDIAGCYQCFSGKGVASSA